MSVQNFYQRPSSYSLEELADVISGRIERGAPSTKIHDVNSVYAADDRMVCSFFSISRSEIIRNCRAAACIVAPRDVDAIYQNSDMAILVSEDPRASLAKTISTFYPEKHTPGIDDSAKISKSATIGEDVAIGPYSVIGKNVKIGAHAVIGSHSHIGDNCIIGAHARIGNSIQIDYAVLDEAVTIHHNSVIGKPGFGYGIPTEDRPPFFIPHIGHVTIGKNVFIGSNTSIDRALFDVTAIEDYTVIGNLTQIAHNVHIQRHCLIGDMVAVAGSAVIEEGTIVAGRATVGDHLRVGKNSIIRVNSFLMENLPEKSDFMGNSRNYERLIRIRQKHILKEKKERRKYDHPC